MSNTRNRALRVMLGFLSFLMVVAGVILIFSSKGLILRLFLHPPESEVTTLLLAAVKEMGGLLLMLAVMLFLAARDPVRNVAIVDGLAVGLCVLAITPIVSLYTTDVGKLYPSYLIWVRSGVRLALSGVVLWLRPRNEHWEPAGKF